MSHIQGRHGIASRQLLTFPHPPDTQHAFCCPSSITRRVQRMYSNAVPQSSKCAFQTGPTYSPLKLPLTHVAERRVPARCIQQHIVRVHVAVTHPSCVHVAQRRGQVMRYDERSVGREQPTRWPPTPEQDLLGRPVSERLSRHQPQQHGVLGGSDGKDARDGRVVEGGGDADLVLSLPIGGEGAVEAFQGDGLAAPCCCGVGEGWEKCFISGGCFYGILWA